MNCSEIFLTTPDLFKENSTITVRKGVPATLFYFKAHNP